MVQHITSEQQTVILPNAKCVLDCLPWTPHCISIVNIDTFQAHTSGVLTQRLHAPAAVRLSASVIVAELWSSRLSCLLLPYTASASCA